MPGCGNGFAGDPLRLIRAIGRMRILSGMDTRNGRANGFNWPMAIQVTSEHGKLIYVAHATGNASGRSTRFDSMNRNAICYLPYAICFANPSTPRCSCSMKVGLWLVFRSWRHLAPEEGETLTGLSRLGNGNTKPPLKRNNWRTSEELITA